MHVKYNIVIKTVYRYIKWKTIFKYCSVVFGFSLFASMVWDVE